MANQQRQFSVINNQKSQGCVLMPEMGVRLNCGVSDTALVSSGASCVAMLAGRHEKVGCCDCSRSGLGCTMRQSSFCSISALLVQVLLQSHPVSLSLGHPH